ncbi:MAG: hypothetical protein HOE90_19835 [Bacteriovoracaceae bacterium]|nr:hypothetical protein [Bacteriovoracaceae bacterium]
MAEIRENIYSKAKKDTSEFWKLNCRNTKILQADFYGPNWINEKELLNSKTQAEFDSKFIEILNSMSPQSFFYIYKLNEIDELKGTILLLDFSKRGKYLSIHNESFVDWNVVAFYIELRTQYKKYLKSKSVNKSQKNLKIWEEVLEIVEKPFAVFNSHADIIYHNKLFIDLKLAPEAASVLSNGENTTLQGNTYQCHRYEFSDFGEKYSLIVLLNESMGKEGSGLTSKDLGIICGSLAHELNNPIAGILSVLTLLELDAADTQLSGEIQEMLERTRRCRDLVQMFLGFSRKTIERSDSFAFGRSVEQALDLLRFRVAQTDIKIDITSHTINSLKGVFNDSIFTMLLYILFSELVTVRSHLDILKNDQGPNPLTISGEVIENETVVRFNLPYVERLKEQLVKNSLFYHLLGQLNGSIEYTTDSCILLSINASWDN